MKSIFRKSAIGLAILGLAGSAYAGTINGAFVGVEGLDLQPRNGDLDFISVFPGSGVVAGTAVGTTAIHPSYSWGFRLYGGLKFCGNDDMMVSWERYRANNHVAFPDPATTSTSIPRYVFPGAFTANYSSVNFHLDDVYGSFGHTFNMYAWSLRTAGGVEWARLISNQEVAALEAPGTVVTDVWDYQAQNNMHGFGPRLDIDVTYHMPYGFGIFAKTNAALLIASRQIELANLAITNTNANDWDFSTRHVVVPHLGMKLGLSFGHLFGEMGGEGAACNGTNVVVEAGWQVDSYIHAIERPEGFDNTGLGTGSASNITTRTSNFATQGLFVGVKLSTGWF